MAMVKDFRSDTDGDLYISDGDFAIYESDNQHIVDIISSNKGSWKEYPLCGVSIDSFINAPVSQQTVKSEVNIQLTNDGYSNIDIVFQDNNSINFEVDAVRS
jgi:hypothetical protein